MNHKRELLRSLWVKTTAKGSFNEVPSQERARKVPSTLGMESELEGEAARLLLRS